MGYKNIFGIDLFSGAGGLSLGAELAGIDVVLAIEQDYNAASTYEENHKNTKIIIDDVINVKQSDLPQVNSKKILFGGPPCQGFSSSNQRTRNKNNPQNWLFMEFVRLVNLWNPNWIVFENVKGFVEIEKGLFYNTLINELEKVGYKCSSFILCAEDYGVPQIRSRFFLIGSKDGITYVKPSSISKKNLTVNDAIGDLPELVNGANEDYLPYPYRNISEYAKKMRNKEEIGCTGNLVTKNSKIVLDRYRYIPQGGNWENIPESLMHNYKNKSRCHTKIYHRLDPNKPSVVIGNYRKNMLIHPFENRGLSVREAARLQSFPDYYQFKGSIGFQQQQVGDAVPPLLAKEVFSKIILECFNEK
ncbi:MAG: DNA cytosine methyltransferase [Candidatus Methanofastidiosa archaeon]|nr:DNA cytosine methyltransferase [Candidatus Methanofastidiosa archaeon]